MTGSSTTSGGEYRHICHPIIMLGKAHGFYFLFAGKIRKLISIRQTVYNVGRKEPDAFLNYSVFRAENRSGFLMVRKEEEMERDGGIEEVRWHGRGGQGAVLGASILGSAAALYEGKYAMSFPSFGAERRGAPVQAFTRVSSHVIRTRSQIYHPTKIVVLDDTLLDVVNITDGAGVGATVLINTGRAASGLSLPNHLRIITIDATAIAKEVIGVAIVNTTMLGALAGATGLVSLESVKRAIADALPEKIAGLNVAAAEIACEKVKGK